MLKTIYLNVIFLEKHFAVFVFIAGNLLPGPFVTSVFFVEYKSSVDLF